MMLTDEQVAYWNHVRAALSEGFCPGPQCGRRLQPTRLVPAGGVGGHCPVHGVRWIRP